MSTLFGRTWTREELLRRVGDVRQVGGVSRQILTEGREAGVEVVEFRTGSGLEFTVLAGRGMDLGHAAFCGKPLGWQSQTGATHAAYFEPEGLGWLRGFHGGLLTTCGLTYAGAPVEDEGETLGLHGRISNTPAENLWVDGAWDGDDYLMWAQGRMREASVFGPHLTLTRKITAKLGESRFHVQDTVENVGWERQPLMMIYHVNAGWPAVDEGAELLTPSETWEPRNPDAEVGCAAAKQMQAPTANFAERVYFHDLKADAQGYTCAAMVNRRCGDGFGFYVRWRKDELPCFTQWKMNGEGTYVCGMEPGNCLPEGRPAEREAGRLQSLEPGEAQNFALEFGVLDGAEALAEFEGGWN